MRHSAVLANLATARINRTVRAEMTERYEAAGEPLWSDDETTPLFACTTGADNLFAIVLYSPIEHPC
jgi:hypothetical protein